MDRACTECGKPAVTKDGRDLCLKCLKKAVAQEVPMTGCYRGRMRSPDQKQDKAKEPNPWAENAIRALEDSQ